MKITDMAREAQRQLKEHGYRASLIDIQTYINDAKRNTEDKSNNWKASHATKLYQNGCAYAHMVEIVCWLSEV